MSVARWRTVLTLGAALVSYFLFAAQRNYPPLLASAAGAAVGGLTYFAFNTALRLAAIFRRSRTTTVTPEHSDPDRRSED